MSMIPIARARPLPSVGYLYKALPHILTAGDLFAGQIVVILWLINAATAALIGAVGLSYWLIGALVFFVPALVAVAQLALLFPGDGGLYHWTYSALASAGGTNRAAAFWSFFAGVCAWMVAPGPGHRRQRPALLSGRHAASTRSYYHSRPALAAGAAHGRPRAPDAACR